MRNENVLFEKLLPTLGDAGIPLIIERIKLAADEGDRWKIGLATKSLVGQNSEKVSSYIPQFLESDSRLKKYAGALIAKQFPDPKYLDDLWAIHCEFVETDQEMKEQDRFAFLDRKESFKALVECSKLNPDWIEDRLVDVDPADSPYHELVYLLANLENPNEIWRKQKEAIKSKVPKDRKRCIATLLACVNDDDEKDWLIQNLSNNDDWLGPTCMPALFNIDPELALQHFDKMDHRELYFHREWFLPDLLLEFPDRGNNKFLELMKNSDDPWQIAMAYQGNANLMSGAVLDCLLQKLPEVIESDLTEEKEPNKGSRLFRPLQLLEKIYKLELIDVLRSEKHVLLDDALATWAISQGGRQSVHHNYESAGALTVLSKINGSGLTKYVNFLLQNESEYARLDGLNYAARNPDDETFELLTSRTQSNELWGRELKSDAKFPLEQGEAAKCLSEHSNWEAVVAYLNKWGLKSLTIIFEYTPDAKIAEQLVKPFLQGELNQNSIEVLSFLRIDSRNNEIVDLLATEISDPDLETACTLAVKRLKISDERAIAPLSRQVNESKNSLFAINSLLSIGTKQALNELADYVGRNPDLELSICLANSESTKDNAVQLIESSLAANKNLTRQGDFQRIALNIYDADLRKRIAEKNIDFVRSFVNQETEGSFRTTGAKHDLVRLLAELNKEEAADTLKFILGKKDFKDAELYPYLVKELFDDEALHLLWETALDEPRTSVRHAIGRSLANIKDSASFLGKFLDGKPVEKMVASELISFGTNIEQYLRSAIDDLRRSSDFDVAKRAREASKRIRENHETELLAQAFLNASTLQDQWRLLPLIAEFSDTGDLYYPPNWVLRVRDSLTPLQRSFLNKTLKDRRKKVAEKLKKEDEKRIKG